MSKKLNFKISSALKNIIGKELINDKFIAVFELVKNSYDAGATRVDIKFTNFYKNPHIEIVDNGCGMNYDDIINKWLFVAYSEKKERNQNDDYRHKIKRVASGAKGVGRFSCDRLGSKLELTTNTKEDKESNILSLDWDNFEQDDNNEFVNVKVDYSTKEKTFSQGTKITISSLREQWSEMDVIRLKKALVRLVNPDIDQGEDIFDIYLEVQDVKDKQYVQELNCKIYNDVFEKLNIKTTSIIVDISKDGQFINTELYDRGTYIYSIKEKNTFKQLRGITTKLFYLSKNAKYAFTTSMGLEPVKYGSVFVYKNCFRIYPYGEPNNDFLDIDKRKAQGYNRYLGTRDIIGRISITCDDKHFIETSSRNSGFLVSPEYYQLVDFFHNKVFKILEDYVVNVIEWGDVTKEDFKKGKTKALTPEDVKLDIINQIASLSKRKEIIDIKYNNNLLDVIKEASSDNLNNTLINLNKIAKSSDNKQLKEIVDRVSNQTKNVFKSNEEDRKKLEDVNKIKERLKNELESEKKKSFFIFDSLSIEQKEFVEKMHTINIKLDTIKNNVLLLHDDIMNDLIKKEDTLSRLKDICFIVEKIHSTTQYGGVADFNLNDTYIVGILSDFIEEYCIKIFKNKLIKFEIINEAKNFKVKFCPQDISTILENLVSNSITAKATQIICNFVVENDCLIFNYEDNGIGLKKNIDVNTIFDFGKSYSNGTGVGMYHIKRIIDSMNGTIIVDKNNTNGFKIQMRIKNERNKNTLV